MDDLTYTTHSSKPRKQQMKRGTLKRTKWERVPGTARKVLKNVGPRTKKWLKAWRFLKPELEARGIVRCEFWFIDHVCDGTVTPAHSKKRNKMKGNDLYAIGLACLTVHRVLDEVYSHEQMEQSVMRAIDSRGGLILPKERE